MTLLNFSGLFQLNPTVVELEMIVLKIVVPYMPIY